MDASANKESTTISQLSSKKDADKISEQNARKICEVANNAEEFAKCDYSLTERRVDIYAHTTAYDAQIMCDKLSEYFKAKNIFFSQGWMLRFFPVLTKSLLAQCQLPTKIVYAASSLSNTSTSKNDSDLSSTQKEGICKVALGKANANSVSDYNLSRKSDNTLYFLSTKGFGYSCEIFGLSIKLSSDGWGRIQPTGNVVRENNCIKLSLYDPGLMMMHEGNYCEPNT